MALVETIVGAVASSAITAALIALDRTKAQNKLMRDAVLNLQGSVEHISNSIERLEKSWEKKIEATYTRASEVNRRIDTLEESFNGRLNSIEQSLVEISLAVKADGASQPHWAKKVSGSGDSKA
jgi:ABC-type transport system involved in cytochrome bd biosynthesis fused ATPase/permease subunit